MTTQSAAPPNRSCTAATRMTGSSTAFPSARRYSTAGTIKTRPRPTQTEHTPSVYLIALLPFHVHGGFLFLFLSLFFFLRKRLLYTTNKSRSARTLGGGRECGCCPARAGGMGGWQGVFLSPFNRLHGLSSPREGRGGFFKGRRATDDMIDDNDA